MMNRVLSTVTACICLSSAAFAADDINEVAAAVAANPAPAPDAPMRLKAVKAMSLQAAGADSGFKDYVYDATGELNVTKGEGRISLNFAVDRHFTEIESAKIVFNAYDVDYPEATEHDVAHFNDASYIRLQGGNNAWHQNSFSVPPEKIRLPETTGQVANNLFYVTVDIDDGGWVTSIGWARLEIRGKEGIVVTATDGTEINGIKVSWTEVRGASYELYRSEVEGSIGTLIARGVGTSYLDERVEWGKPYYYTVKASTGDEGSDDGLFDGILPEIEEFELPDFWLENKAPLAITWNEHSDKQFEVLSYVVRIEKGGEKHDLPPVTPPSNLSGQRRIFSVDKNFRFEDFGIWEVSITWTVREKITGQILNDGKAYGPGVAKGTIKVFFNKYEKNGGESNWFTYWPKMGALSSAKFKGTGFNYAPPQGNTYGRCHGEVFRAPNSVSVRTPPNFPPINCCSPKNKYFLYDLAAAHGKTDTVRGKTIGSSSKGIAFVPAVMAHELRHGELNDETYGVTGWFLGYVSSHKNTGYGSLQEVIADLEQKGFDKTYPDYYAAVKNCQHCDLDGDGLLDEHENGKYKAEWGFLSNNPNTHNFPGSDYATYGDNEVLARYAEANPPSDEGLNRAKDWAFPGSQNVPDAEGMSPSEWNVSSEKRTATQTFNRFNTLSFNSVAKAAPAKLLSSSSGQRGGDLSEFDADVDIESERFAVGGIVSDLTENYLSVGGYSSLCLAVAVTNLGQKVDSVVFRGTLADAEGNPVAWSETSAMEFPTGRMVVSLAFPGASVRRLKGTGYKLAEFEVIENSGDISTVACLKKDVGATRTYRSTDFDCRGVCVLANAYEERKDKSGLTVQVGLDVADERSYDVNARLETLDGKFVSNASVKGISGIGEKSVELKFPAQDIYLSKCDGPYVISRLTVSCGNVDVADVRDAFQTSDCFYLEFMPSDVLLSVVDGSFASTGRRIGSDGEIDALGFSFSIANRSSAPVSCHVKMRLNGASENFVCSAECDVELKAGSNQVALEFSGQDIRKGGVSGPYYVSEIFIQPTVGSSDRFFPKMDPIDLNPEDFGAYPFELQGDPAVTTGSGAAAYSVSVPLKILRANKVTVMALMVDAEGRYVATATKSVQYDAPGATVMSISFSEEDIQASGRRGPYTIRYLRIESDLQGVAPLRVTSFRSEQIERQYQLYVDAARPDDSGDGLTPATAKRTIQAAVDRAKDGDVVVVASGTYAPFDADNKRIEIVSRFGYQYTIVDGGSVRRCATLGHEEAQTNTVLRGFTLQNGDTTGDELVLWNCGGGVCGGTVQNCYITGCHASKGGGAYYGRLENCLIEGNEADTYGGGSYYGTRVNCTIVGNRASYSAGGTYDGTSVNSIIWSNSYGSYTLYEGNWSNGSFDHCVTTPCPDGNGNRAADPSFTKPGSGDYTLSSNSTCIDAGRADVVATATDLAGNPRIAGTGVDIGAFEQPRNPFVYGQADFVRSVLEVSEGGTVTLEVWGGLENVASSVYLYLPSADGTTKDVDLTKVKVDGKTVKNAKFPLKLTWAAGELSARKVSIPVKTDSSVEGGEILYFQLGKASGMALGTYRLCQVVVKDMSVPSVSLATAANSTGLKVKTSGSGKWKAANGNAYYVSGENRGGYHLVTPKLAKGKQTKLTFSGVKGKGNMVVMFRFTGDTAERTSSTLKIYAGKNLLRTYYHTSTGNGWQRHTIEDSTTSSHTYSYVFTQGSDSATHVELVGSYFKPKGKSTPYMVYVTTLNSNYGSVTGMGFYRSGQTVKITAKANPGHVFKGWYKWSDSEGKYVYWTKTAKKSFKAAANLDIAAMFAPYATVTPLSWQPERGTVSGGGACAPGKKVTLKAKAKSGYVFAGWYLNGNRVSLSATYKAPCPSGNVIYYAYFVTASEDKKSVVASVGGLSFAAGGAAPVTKATQTATCGVTVKWPVAAEALSSTSVKVTGLPTGLSYDSKKKAIVGVPTKTGTKTATVAVTTAGKSTVKFSLTIKVNPLPSWAKGAFEGFEDKDGKPRRVTFTVSSVGKFSGTVAFAGETWKLAVSSYAAEYDGWFEANVKATKGKSSKSVRVIVYKSDHGGLAYSEVSGFEFDAVQNRWSSDPSLKALAAQLKGRVVKIGDDLTVTIGKAGAVTAKLKTKQGTFSASATLLPAYEEDETPSRYFVGFRFAPDTKKKFKGAVRLVVLE